MISAPGDRFRHEALFYSNAAEFVTATARFISEGLVAEEPVLVVESKEKIDMLRSTLGQRADRVIFADMAAVGANPARIIPAWQDFVERHPSSKRLRGIGEPIWNGRSPEELVECQRHEALLNTAFDPGRPWWLLCPYDTSQLPSDVLEEARHSHEAVHHREMVVEPSAAFRSGQLNRAPLNLPLREPKKVLLTYSFDASKLAEVRRKIHDRAITLGLPPSQAADLVVSANEVATNSIVHGPGIGVVRLWDEADRVVCEVWDHCKIDDPLADRTRPTSDPGSRRGLWLANQLCDLVQVRSGQNGTTVRLHVRKLEGRE
jgi:anti-sigma regulatory factor (Ser/Thr protein kinase)